jgi:hypothetical protein
MISGGYANVLRMKAGDTLSWSNRNLEPVIRVIALFSVASLRACPCGPVFVWNFSCPNAWSQLEE